MPLPFQLKTNRGRQPGLFDPKGGILAQSMAHGMAPRSAGPGGGYSQATSPDWGGIQQPRAGETGFHSMPNEDPAGAGVQIRGLQHRQDFENQMRASGMSMPINALPSMAWEGFKQALAEHGVSRLRDDSVGQARGMWSSGIPQNEAPLEGTPGLIARNFRSTQNPALAGLQNYQSHDQFMKRYGR